jgi:hypothetical protein
VLILQFVGQIIYLVIAIILHILPDLALLWWALLNQLLIQCFTTILMPLCQLWKLVFLVLIASLS